MNWDSLLNVPLEKWRDHGVNLCACSFRSDGTVTSFIAKVRGSSTKWYGWRKQTKDGETFEVEES